MAATTPRYGHPPIAMRRMQSDDLSSAGDFYWEVGEDGSRFLSLAEPTPRPDNSGGWTYARIPVRQGPNETGKYWGWDGNEDAPTLTPSIHTIGHWHGWVRAGRLIEA